MTEPVPDPVLAHRSAPGEYFLEAESVEVGLRFRYRDAVYEVAEILAPVDTGVVLATIRMVEGRAVGKDFTARLHTGRRMDT